MFTIVQLKRNLLNGFLLNSTLLKIFFSKSAEFQFLRYKFWVTSVVICCLLILSTACSVSPESRIEKAEEWMDQLEINLTQIAKRGYGDKKRLAEALGVYWKLYRYAPQEQKQNIRNQAMPLFKYTQKSQYVNYLIKADAKNFKKNSMSYFRIMWLLREMNFNIDHLEVGLQKLMKKMNAHLKLRGAWQKAMFVKYYDEFELKKPYVLTSAKHFKGVVSKRYSAQRYQKLDDAYRLTHQIFVAYNYGAQKKQTRFNDEDIAYMQGVLPEVTDFYIAKSNWDIVAELITSMLYLGMSDTEQFNNAYQQLLNAQNKNGSWGAYENLRKKYGKYTDAKYYLHTTGVVLETIIETERGEW